MDGYISMDFLHVFFSDMHDYLLLVPLILLKCYIYFLFFVCLSFSLLLLRQYIVGQIYTKIIPDCFVQIFFSFDNPIGCGWLELHWLSQSYISLFLFPFWKAFLYPSCDILEAFGICVNFRGILVNTLSQVFNL